MKFFKISAVALAMLAAPLASAASAKTLDYDFTGQGQTASSFDLTSNGVDLKVTGYYNSYFFGFQKANLTRWDNGLGIRSFLDENHEIDGFLSQEYVSFEFSENVDRLESLSFDFVDRKDSFKLYDSNWNKLFDSKISRDETGKVTFAFAEGTDFSGSVFFLGATGKHNDYKLRGLTASVGDIAPVPLPAGGFLLVSGIFGLGAARRLRRKAAA